MTVRPMLVSRQAPAVEAPNLPAVRSAASEQLDTELRYAKAISDANEALPRAYRGRPGAVLLAREWGVARNVDLLTVLQTVTFLEGKPVVDATMQRALAERAGYEVIVAAVSNMSATVEVHKGGRKLGEETFTIEDAKRQELAHKANWKKTPKNMLVARATTNALKWFAPSVVVGLVTDDDVTLDALDVLAQPEHVAIEHPADGTLSPPLVADEPDEIIDAEIVDPEPEVIPEPVAEVVAEGDEAPEEPWTPDDLPDEPWTPDDLRELLRQGGLKQVDLLRAIGMSSLAAIIADDDALTRAVEWIHAGGQGPEAA